MAGLWSAYEYQPSFILGFHGCDKKVADKILSGAERHLEPSEKKYDWLGHGIYFWEGNPSRAMSWAEQRKAEGRIKEPYVLGAIINLQHCLDLFDNGGLTEVKEAYAGLRKVSRAAGISLPRNVGATPDLAGRMLDCAVMNYLHEYCKERGGLPYDSIRGPFLEGKPLYRGAGFRSHNHIQICVRDTACIKGYFRPFTLD